MSIQNSIFNELRHGRAPKQAVGYAYSKARRSRAKKGTRTKRRGK